jgi:UTP--glucose-1-phosphate uridylyltransferase
MIFVTGRGKSAIEDHFDIAYELETTMRDRGKSIELLHQTRLKPGAVAYVRQQEPMGLGHAVWCARDIVGDEPFAVLLADDFMVGSPGCLKQMVDAYEQVGGNMICAQIVPEDQTHLYGIITPGTRDGRADRGQGTGREAPRRAPRRRTSSVIGRYILQPEVMRVLEIRRKARATRSSLPTRWPDDRDQPFHGLTFSTASVTIAATRPATSTPIWRWHRARGYRPGGTRVRRGAVRAIAWCPKILYALWLE